MPRCNNCGQDKPQSEYYRDGTRYKAVCKDCIRRATRLRQNTPEHREYMRKYMQKWREHNPAYYRKFKRCSKCGRRLRKHRFFADSKSQDGLRSECKDCTLASRDQAAAAEYMRQYRATNPPKKPVAGRGRGRPRG